MYFKNVKKKKKKKKIIIILKWSNRSSTAEDDGDVGTRKIDLSLPSDAPVVVPFVLCFESNSCVVLT